MELRRLRLLAELRRRGTVAAVAEALSYSPSTVSAQLALLQQEAGTTLLRRVGRKLELTSAGERLADHADQALHAEEVVRADLASIDTEPQGTVRVSFVQSAGIALMPGMLRHLAGRAPRLRVELIQRETGAALDELRTRALDVVVGTDYEPISPPLTRDLDRHDLLEEDIHVAVPASRDDAGTQAVLLSSFERDVWAAGTPLSGHALLVEHLCQRLGGYHPDIRHRSDDSLVLNALVSSGQAVTLLPALVGVTTDHVACLEIAGIEVRRTVFSATRTASRDTAATRAVRSALRDVASRIAENRKDLRAPHPH